MAIEWQTTAMRGVGYIRAKNQTLAHPYQIDVLRPPDTHNQFVGFSCEPVCEGRSLMSRQLQQLGTRLLIEREPLSRIPAWIRDRTESKMPRGLQTLAAVTGQTEALGDSESPTIGEPPPFPNFIQYDDRNILFATTLRAVDSISDARCMITCSECSAGMVAEFGTCLHSSGTLRIRGDWHRRAQLSPND
jgi:hypothetical protein